MEKPTNSDSNETLLTHISSHPGRFAGAINVPVWRASTMIFETLADFEAAEAGNYAKGTTYGRHGTPTHIALREAISALEKADQTFLASSGLNAIVTSLLGVLSAGDHLLVVDTVYWPTRALCEKELPRFGIETTFFDPALTPDALAALFKPNTKLLYVESPGSHTMEVMDIPALAAVAHEKGALVLADNTWAAGLLFQPLTKGVDISIQSLTKYASGHADVLMGSISVREKHAPLIARSLRHWGPYASGDDAYLVLRGLRTLALRLQRHGENALKIAQWLEQQPEVVEARYPALPSSPGHALWKRDFSGACGLLSFVLKPCSKSALAALFDGLRYFALGYSWGGFESLLIPVQPHALRTATKWPHEGAVLRLHAGLESADDLVNDLAQAFARLRKA